MDDHDVQISVWIRNTEDMVAIVMDPDFQALVADEDKMVDSERATLIAGWEEVYVEDGEYRRRENQIPSKLCREVRGRNRDSGLRCTRSHSILE